MQRSNTHSRLIYITGMPGVGKYTIAVALREFGFIVCDNQLINNPIFELLGYDGYTQIPDFAWDAIERIRRVVFDFLIHTKDVDYVLTNNLNDDEGDRMLYQRVVQVAEARGSVFIPVRLVISKEEHLRRVTNLQRRARWKSIDPRDIEGAEKLLPITHSNLLTLDVTALSAQESAKRIVEHIRNLS